MHKALEDFGSEYKGKINLEPEFADVLVKELNSLSDRYGYRYAIDNLPTERVVVPANEDGEDATVEYRNRVKLLEHFSDNNVDVAQRNATVLWGAGEWDPEARKVIRPLQNGTEVVGNNITALGKNVLRDRMQSKILAAQLWHLLSDDAQRSIALEPDKYEWRSADGREVENDGIVLLALILARVKPHCKADMFDEVNKLKSTTLKQKGNGSLFFCPGFRST